MLYKAFDVKLMTKNIKKRMDRIIKSASSTCNLCKIVFQKIMNFAIFSIYFFNIEGMGVLPLKYTL